MNFQDESQYYFDSCTSLNKGDSPEIIFEFMHNSSIGVALNHGNQIKTMYDEIY